MTGRMTPAELLTITEWLGLTQAAAAEYLGVAERTVRHWIEGKYLIPEGVRGEIERLEASTAQAVAEVVAALHDASEVGVMVYRTDAEMWAARPEIRPMTARWWRAVVARAAHEVPGVAIAFYET